MRRTVSAHEVWCLRPAWVMLLLLLSWGSIHCSNDAGDPLTTLQAAKAGDTIRLAPGTYPGPLVVPAGVTLQGEEGVIIAGTGGEPALTIETAQDLQTQLQGLRITSTGKAALIARGQGSFSATDLSIVCEQGLGLAAEELSSIKLQGVRIEGSITADQVSDLVFPLSATDGPIIGLLLSHVAQAELEDVSVTGFGGFGAAFLASTISWSQGEISKNVGVGLIAEGAKLTLQQGVAIRETWAGERGAALFSYGLIMTDGSEVSTSGLTISDGAGIGVLQQESTAAHTGLHITRQQDVGYWLQSSSGDANRDALVIKESSEIEESRGGGLFAINSGRIQLLDSAISRTQKKTIVSSEVGSVEMADGLQLQSLTAGGKLQHLTLTDNARVGILLSGPAPAGGLTFDQISLTGGGMYGLIPENDYPPDDQWQVTRDPALQQADEAFSGQLAVAKQKTIIPSLSALQQKGLLAQDGLLQRGATITEHGLDVP